MIRTEHGTEARTNRHHWTFWRPRLFLCRHHRPFRCWQLWSVEPGSSEQQTRSALFNCEWRRVRRQLSTLFSKTPGRQHEQDDDHKHPATSRHPPNLGDGINLTHQLQQRVEANSQCFILHQHKNPPPAEPEQRDRDPSRIPSIFHNRNQEPTSSLPREPGNPQKGVQRPDSTHTGAPPCGLRTEQAKPWKLPSPQRKKKELKKAMTGNE
jgi:hypothetical protein